MLRRKREEEIEIWEEKRTGLTLHGKFRKSSRSPTSLQASTVQIWVEK